MSFFNDLLEIGHKKLPLRGLIWRAWWLLQHSNVSFCKKLPDSQGIINWNIVMMNHPCPCFPQFSSFLNHLMYQMLQDVFVDIVVDGLALWQNFA